MSEQFENTEVVVPVDEIKAGNILNDKYVVDSIISNHSLKASVFHAYCGGRQYAVKIYKFCSTCNKLDIAKLGCVDSPFVASTVEIFNYGGNVAVVTPYYAKGSLDGSKISTKELKEFVLPQINEGLSKLHYVNLQHGDLKPSNILIGDDGKTFALTDYGQYLFSRDSNDEFSYCKKEFTAPEVFEGNLNDYSDYYSLGMTIYALICGNLDSEHTYASMTQEEMNEFIKNPVNKVPLPEIIPDIWRKLIYALTYVKIDNDDRKHDKRWGYKEIVKWINGETLLYPTELVDKFSIGGVTCFTLDDFRQLLIEKGENINTLRQFCSNVIDSDGKLNPDFEKWLITLGKQPEIENWKKIL